MVFQENLIQLRKKANLSQEQLADKLITGSFTATSIFMEGAFECI